MGFSKYLWIFTDIWEVLSQASYFKSSYFCFSLFCFSRYFLLSGHLMRVTSLAANTDFCVHVWIFFCPAPTLISLLGLLWRFLLQLQINSHVPLMLLFGLKKLSDLVLKTEQRTLEDTWRWVLNTHLNANLEYRKEVNTLKIFFLPSLSNWSEPVVMFKILPVFTVWKRSSVIFFALEGVCFPFLPNAWVLLYKKNFFHVFGEYL